MRRRTIFRNGKKLRKGIERYQKREYAEAEKTFAELKRAFPDDFLYPFWIGKTLESRSLFKDALKLYRQALKLNPSNETLWTAIRRLEKKIENHADPLESSLSLFNANPTLHNLLKIKRIANRRDGATRFRLYSSLLRHHPDLDEIRKGMLSLYEEPEIRSDVRSFLSGNASGNAEWTATAYRLAKRNYLRNDLKKAKLYAEVFEYAASKTAEEERWTLELLKRVSEKNFDDAKEWLASVDTGKIPGDSTRLLLLEMSELPELRHAVNRVLLERSLSFRDYATPLVMLASGSLSQDRLVEFLANRSELREPFDTLLRGLRHPPSSREKAGSSSGKTVAVQAYLEGDGERCLDALQDGTGATTPSKESKTLAFLCAEKESGREEYLGRFSEADAKAENRLLAKLAIKRAVAEGWRDTVRFLVAKWTESPWKGKKFDLYRARLVFDAKNYSKAFDLFEEAIPASDHPDDLYRYGFSAYKIRRYETAAAMMENYLLDKPFDLYAKFYLAKTRVASNAPEAPDAVLSLLLLTEGKWNLSRMRERLESEGRGVDFYFRAYEAYQKNRWQDALRILEGKASELHPDFRLLRLEMLNRLKRTVPPSFSDAKDPENAEDSLVKEVRRLERMADDFDRLPEEFWLEKPEIFAGYRFSARLADQYLSGNRNRPTDHILPLVWRASGGMKTGELDRLADALIRNGYLDKALLIAEYLSASFPDNEPFAARTSRIKAAMND